MADPVKPQDKQAEVAIAASAAAPVADKSQGFTVTNNSTRYLSIYHDGKRFEFLPQSVSAEMQMTTEAAKALGESLKAFPGLIVSPVKKAG